MSNNLSVSSVRSADGLPTRLEAAKQDLSSQQEQALAFVGQVARLRIWSYTRNDGSPYEECETPSWGFLDSHDCLMALVEQARRIQAGNCDPASLEGYDDGATVAELYDTHPAFAEAINNLIPGFEYPDWSYRTIADIKQRLRAA